MFDGEMFLVENNRILLKPNFWYQSKLLACGQAKPGHAWRFPCFFGSLTNNARTKWHNLPVMLKRNIPGFEKVLPGMVRCPFCRACETG